MMPILPFIEDHPQNIQQIVSRTGESGASYIIPAFGVSLRAGSRDYFFQKLDQHFPGIRKNISTILVMTINAVLRAGMN